MHTIKKKEIRQFNFCKVVICERFTTNWSISRKTRLQVKGP